MRLYSLIQDIINRRGYILRYESYDLRNKCMRNVDGLSNALPGVVSLENIYTLNHDCKLKLRRIGLTDYLGVDSFLFEDQPRSGRPSTSRTDENVDKINTLVRRTRDQLCEMSGISWSSIQRILSKYLLMRRVAAKFVPRLLLTDEQRERRLHACFQLQNQLEEDPEFFSKVKNW